ncbi:hypothetical protein GCK72_015872 [Caenorhabditis remanei]|uniref:Uncharacterized protein n=1 Tax=Caenorhabditis remanei TaxID=31234 RepID=A0A6A5GXY7_CAERE|nr:hypothetical protein GCK72_015872 [Caenorhabditis remanei]KAF1759405.1 hypothetical protein GCK72_015872 [Caenorhabditis remanei]
MLEEQVEKKRKKNEELNKIIAQQAAELTESKNLIADKNAEIQNLIKNSAKEDQTESKIISQAAEIQKLETWITNLTTMSHVQSDPVRFLTIEKELARVSSELKAFEEAELKKENERLKDQKELLEAMLQSKKKLEEQVEEANKKIEELSLLLKEKNDKIEAITQKIQEQSANLKEARHLMSCSLSLIDIQKDKIEAQQEEIAKLLKGSETVQ